VTTAHQDAYEPSKSPDPAYPALLAISADRYLNQLRSANLSRGGHHALRSLEDSVAACRMEKSDVQLERVTFTWDLMQQVPLNQADDFTNHYQLGYGRDDAPVISMGTEHAYQLLVKNPDGSLRDVGLREMAAECGCVLYWLTASRPDIASKLLGSPDWHWRRPFTIGWPYHIYTAEYHRVGGGGTWATIGRGLLRAGDNWRRALGDRCYQIEVSAHPARKAAGGREVNALRINFLKEVLVTLRKTARVLLFHGVPKSTGSDPRGELAQVFLGLDTLPSPRTIIDDHGEGARVYDAGEHRVIFARALNRLNRHVTDNYLASLAGLVAEAAPTAIDR
jgi:hypothetical protein